MAIATAGLTLALVAAVPLALLSVRVLSISALTGPMAPLPALVRLLVRWVLIVLRSVPELIWALVFVRVVGLGPTAGVLAIALTFTGMLGKVYAEILDSAEPHAAASLLRNGSGRLQTFLYALLPQNAAELTSYTVYRWECAIRSSAVLGFVGAGGLGQQMDASMKMFQGAEGGHHAAGVHGAGLAGGPHQCRTSTKAGMSMHRSSAPRPSANRCLACWGVAAGALAMVGLSFWSLDLQWSRFLSGEALGRMGRFVAELPPARDPSGVSAQAVGSHA